MTSATLIEEFLILGMVVCIVFTVSHVSPIIPCGNFSGSWHVDTIIFNQYFGKIMTYPSWNLFILFDY